MQGGTSRLADILQRHTPGHRVDTLTNQKSRTGGEENNS